MKSYLQYLLLHSNNKYCDELKNNKNLKNIFPIHPTAKASGLSWTSFCKECGHVFYPWNALMVTSEKTNWKEWLYCPSCNNFDDKENFRKG